MNIKSVKKEYTNGEITIVWQNALCIHSANCVKNLSSVFKPQQSPWINMENANTIEIIEAAEIKLGTHTNKAKGGFNFMLGKYKNPYEIYTPNKKRKVYYYLYAQAQTGVVLFNEALKYIEAVKNKMVREGISRDEVNRYFFIQGRENPYEDKVPLKLFTIRPNAPLGGGPGGLSFDTTEMKAMITKGKNAATNFIAALPSGDISWA
jgi:uncharacterized Fe-S cluster protein YjdI